MVVQFIEFKFLCKYKIKKINTPNYDNYLPQSQV